MGVDGSRGVSVTRPAAVGAVRRSLVDVVADDVNGVGKAFGKKRTRGRVTIFDTFFQATVLPPLQKHPSACKHLIQLPHKPQNLGRSFSQSFITCGIPISAVGQGGAMQARRRIGPAYV